MTIHTLPDTVRNSDIKYCIDEYVRNVTHREILIKHWFEGETITNLADQYHLSDTAIKKVIYKTGDKILLKASKM